MNKSKATPKFYLLALASVMIIAGIALYFGVSASGEPTKPSPYTGAVMSLIGASIILGAVISSYARKHTDRLLSKAWNKFYHSTTEGIINRMFG